MRDWLTTITPASMVHRLYQEQILPISIDEAWEFFATPINLNQVTPKDLDFKILSDLPKSMYEGMIILYRIKVMGVTMNWCTEITHIKDKVYFVDEQRKGPYGMWHHEHHFSPTSDGKVLMKDILHYDIGWGLLGDLAGHLFVHKKVQHIFSHRFKVLEAHWSKSQ